MLYEVDPGVPGVVDVSVVASALASEQIDHRVRTAMCAVYRVAQGAGDPRAGAVVGIARALKTCVESFAGEPSPMIGIAELGAQRAVQTHLGPGNGVGACAQARTVIAAEKGLQSFLE